MDSRFPLDYAAPISKEKIHQYRIELSNILADISQFTNTEIAEAYERLGMSLFFYGAYKEAEQMLLQCLRSRKELPISLNNCRVSLLV